LCTQHNKHLCLFCCVLPSVLCLLSCFRGTRQGGKAGKGNKKVVKKEESPFPPRAPHAFCCQCCSLFSPSRREVSPSFLGDRRGSSCRRDSGGSVRVSCRDSAVDGGSDGVSNGGRSGLGDRGGLGGSPGPVQGGVGPALVELGAPSRAHAAHGDVRGGGATAPRGAAICCRRAQAREHDVAMVGGGMVREEGKQNRKGEREKSRPRRRPPKRIPLSLSQLLNP